MNTQPLLRRTVLRPGESLPSLLERLAQLNYYAHSRVIDWICHKRAGGHDSPDHAARPQRAQTFFHLAQLIGISPETLFAASDHHLAPALTRPGQKKAFMLWLDGLPRQKITNAIVARRIRSSVRAQYCPMCLKTFAYHRLSWVPVASTICLQHQCLLVDRCPQCGQAVSVAEVVRCQCKTCRADLRLAQAISVASDEVGIFSQQVIQHWLSVAPAPQLPQDAVLPQQPPDVLYCLLDGLRLSLCVCHTDWPNLPDPLAGLAAQIGEAPNSRTRPSPTDAYYLYRAAFQGICPWPQGLYAFFDAYSQRNQKASSAQSVPGRLGTLWPSWFRLGWRHPAFEFLQQRLVDYLLTRQIPLPNALIDRYLDEPWFAQRTDLFTEQQTLETLGISAQVLHTFCTSFFGPFGQCWWPHRRPRDPPLFVRTRVLHLKETWKEGWPIGHVVSRLGLSREDIVKLVNLGMLSLERGQDQVFYDDWILNRRSVELFFCSVDRRLKVYEEHCRGLCSLGQVAQMTTYDGIDAVDWLRAVLDGVVPGYKCETTLHNLMSVSFPCYEIASFRDQIHAHWGRISGRAFAWQQGMDFETIRQWVGLGLIQPTVAFLVDMWFDHKELAQLTEERALSERGQSQYL